MYKKQNEKKSTQRWLSQLTVEQKLTTLTMADFWQDITRFSIYGVKTIFFYYKFDWRRISFVRAKSALTRLQISSCKVVSHLASKGFRLDWGRESEQITLA